jgi:hypothetical protein
MSILQFIQLFGEIKMKTEYKSRIPTEEEIFYFKMSVESPKNTIEIYDKIFSVFIATAGIMISLNSSNGFLNILSYIFSWLCLLFSIMGVLPKEKAIQPNYFKEMKEFVEARIQFKKKIIFISIISLFISFCLNLYSKINL